MTFQIVCKECGKEFEWHARNKIFCEECIKFRNNECLKRYKAKLKAGAGVPTEAPRQTASLEMCHDQILELLKGGMSTLRIAMKIGYDHGALLTAIGERSNWMDIRTELRRQERLDDEASVRQVWAAMGPVEFIPLTPERLKRCGAGWLGGREH